MGPALPPQSLLTELTRICSHLPEAECTVRADHADFRVRGRVFAYFLNNHHGDGIVSVCCKSEMAENIDRAKHDPENYYVPPYIGPRGWFGMRLDRGAPDWDEVRNIVENSYRIVAPKTLARKIDEQPA